MFLYGNQIVNDFNFKDLFNHLISIKAVRGNDYIYQIEGQIILKPTSKITNDTKCFRYKRISTEFSLKNPIGRAIDLTNKIVIDYVYDDIIDTDIIPFTVGWNYDYNYTSVSTFIMNLISTIPIDKRFNPMYVATYICSRIDSCNDPTNGLIEGRWEKTFTGGREPTEWKSSREIFSERLIKNEPVKYGQCWVLSDLLTGIFNFLGINARTVKVQPCIMDIYHKNGVDFCQNSVDMSIKSNQLVDIDPRKFLEKNITYKISENNLPKKIILKGPIYSIDNNISISTYDLYNLDYFYYKYKNESWNYHVWTEVSINNKWYIFDPSPLHSVDNDKFKPYLERNDNLKFFGPVSINNIVKNKRPDILKHNFDYIFSCINGHTRIWHPIVSKIGGTTLYLNNIIYNKAIVTQRNKHGILFDVTSRYHPSYLDLHKNNPVYFMKTSNDCLSQLLVIINDDNIESNYVIQLCIMKDNVPLYIHREKMPIIIYEKLLFLKDNCLKKYRQIANRVTIAIYDIKHNLFWSQCIQT